MLDSNNLPRGTRGKEGERAHTGRWFAAKAPSQTIIIIIHIEIIFFVYGPYFICGMILDITPPAQDTHGQQKKIEPDSNLTLIAT